MVMPLADFRKPRLFVDVDLAAGAGVALDRNQSNYLGNVLRLSAGDTILVFNGRDGEWQAAISGRKRPDRLEAMAQTRLQDRLPGPEGGFAEDERALLLRQPQTLRLSLGPRILRADTAAVAALALAQAVLGAWTDPRRT